jgi:V8-like Glu-specific endopeptidase
MTLQFTPAIAASSDANTGGPEDSGTEDPVSLPGTAPFVPPEITVNRDVTDEAAPPLDALATISKSSDGTVREVAASPALAAALASTAADETDSRSGPAGAEAGGGLKGVKKTSVYPYRAVGLLNLTYGKNTYVCTGTLIGPRTVLTMAKCLYGVDGKSGWVDDIEFYPGFNKGKAPYKPYRWSDASIMKGYLDPTVRIGSSNIYPYLIAVVILDQPAGNKLGWLGIATDPNDTYNASVISYGTDKSYDAMSTTTCAIDASTMSGSSAFIYDCSAEGWGNPLYVTDQGDKQLYVTGMFDWTYDDGARGLTRLTPAIYQWLVDNRK